MNNVTYALIMFFAGIGIPIMAALNGGLGLRLQNSVLATSILFSEGLALSLSVLALTSDLPEKPLVVGTPWYFYFGGVFVIFYILSITVIASRFGVGNAVSFVLLGQLIAMCIIDHFGFLGAPRFEMNAQRFIGLIIMTVGVLLVVRRT
jgi:transporter family-2 protein